MSKLIFQGCNRANRVFKKWLGMTCVLALLALGRSFPTTGQVAQPSHDFIQGKKSLFIAASASAETAPLSLPIS